MKTIICTLFEGHYHYGAAALINSLHKYGFEGEFFIGYRGELPFWAEGTTDVNIGIELEDWKSVKKFQITEKISLYFVLLDTSYHFANYKPLFMCDLWESVAEKPDYFFYFDPDIVIKCDWHFFEEWSLFGVALVHEIIQNDMPANHPVRKKWEAIVEERGYYIYNHIVSYINSGFCGVWKDNIEFIYLWKIITEYAISKEWFELGRFNHSLNRSNPFFAPDQDAMNIAAMIVNLPISEYGPEGMDFLYGGGVMSHAIGGSKPWRKQYLKSFFKGNPPTLADKEYWNNTQGLIKLYSSSFHKRKMISMKIASFLGRFYRKY